MSELLNIDLAQQQLLDFITPLTRTETVPLLEALGRVLAREYHAQIDVPPAANSAMDGYAVNTSDCFLQARFPVSQRIAAGAIAQPLKFGTAARIFTGAEIPAGANAVVIQEDCTVNGDEVSFNIAVTPGENIRPQGQDIAQGDLLFSHGHLLRAQDVALLASVNVHEVQVLKKIRVAIFSTGDELVEPGNALIPGKIYNSNRYLLHGLLRKLDCDILDLGIVQDSLAATVSALEAASQADFIISSGGVSVGEEDHVKAAVEQLGKIQLWKLNLKPGKPLAFGHVQGTPFIGLPGNPVSAFVTFQLLVKAMLQKRQGRAPVPHKITEHRSLFSIDAPRKRCEFLRAQITPEGVQLHPQQSSGALSSVVWANCLVRVDEGVCVAWGDKVKVYALED